MRVCEESVDHHRLSYMIATVAAPSRIRVADSSAMNTIQRLECGKRYSEVTVHNKVAYLAGKGRGRKCCIC